MGAREKVAASLGQRDWSAGKVSKKAGVPATTFRGWLNGQNEKISFEAMTALARVLGISLDWLTADELPDDTIPEWAWKYRVPGMEAAILGVQDQTEQYRRKMRGELAPPTHAEPNKKDREIVLEVRRQFPKDQADELIELIDRLGFLGQMTTVLGPDGKPDRTRSPQLPSYQDLKTMILRSAEPTATEQPSPPQRKGRTATPTTPRGRKK